jgi:hypothetical protein
LPHFWIIATLGGVAALCAGAYLWEQQLPRKLSLALSTDDLPACLRYGEQLAALRWLGQKAPEELAICRRKLAQQTWSEDDPGQALLLQEQLVNSGVGSPEQKEQDQEQLKLWRDELREQALSQFRAGNLNDSLIMLRPLEKHDGRPGSRLSEQPQGKLESQSPSAGNVERACEPGSVVGSAQRPQPTRSSLVATPSRAHASGGGGGH